MQLNCLMKNSFTGLKKSKPTYYLLEILVFPVFYLDYLAVEFLVSLAKS